MRRRLGHLGVAVAVVGLLAAAMVMFAICACRSLH
jgi:hypothetical protein